MSLRRQLPVYSPITAMSLLKATAGLLGGARQADQSIAEWLAEEFGA